MNVGIYARQSIDKQDSLSIEGQINMCQSEIVSSDNQIVYCDKGFSGKNTNRPEYIRMMNDVREGRINKIVVYRLDRLSRSLLDFAEMWQLLDKHKVSFVSVSEKFDTTTPMGRAMIYIILIFAQLERETISERVRDNYYERLKTGRWPGGPAPYGFDNGRTADNVPTLIPNDKIAVVNNIYNRYIEEGSSLGSLSKELTLKGILSPSGKAWDTIAVSRILQNPVYVNADIDIYTYYKQKGISKFSNHIEDFNGTCSAMILGKRDAATRKYSDFNEHTLALTNFEGVIPSDIFLKCQYKLARNKQLKNNGKGKHTWLTGLIKCGKCGYAAVVKFDYRKGKKTIPYLACSGRFNKHICAVTRLTLTVEEIEQEVEKQLCNVIDQFKDEDIEYVDVKDSNAKLQLVKIEESIERLLDAVSNSEEVTIDYLNKKIIELDKQRQKILRDVEQSSRKNQIMEQIDFTGLDMNNKHLVAEQFIEKILVSDDEIEIFWKV